MGKKMYLPVIKSDMVLEEAYGGAPPSHPPLACPIIAIRGKACPLVSRADTDPWLKLTGEETTSRVEEVASGLEPGPMGPWLCDWYLCQGEESVAAITKLLAKTFGGA